METSNKKRIDTVVCSTKIGPMPVCHYHRTHQ